MSDVPEEKIREFAFNHGNQFHARVVALLREEKWEVLVSPFYRDNATDKAREVDIVSEQEFIMNDRSGAYRGSGRVRLIVECKYITTPVVMWFDNKDLSRVEKRVTNDTILTPDNINGHHWYSEPQAAKLFATYNDGAEGKQPENEPVFGAVDKVLNALISYRHINSIVPERDKRNPVWPNKLPTYPIIVCNDFSKFYFMPFDGSGQPSPTDAQYFQIEVNYAYTRFIAGMRQEVKDYFLVDVVNFRYLKQYLDTHIKGDVKAMGSINNLIVAP